MSYITRQAEQIIRQSAATFKCVLVTGARQTGKSTVIRHLFPSYRSISFDDAFLEAQAKDNADMFVNNSATSNRACKSSDTCSRTS